MVYYALMKTTLHSIAQNALKMRVGCAARKWGGYKLFGKEAR